MNHFQYRSLALLIASLHSFAPLSAAELYLGDAAAEGVNILEANDGTYSIEELTIVMHTGSPVIYTPTVAQELILTQVNFVSAYTDESTDGFLTPFVAAYDETNNNGNRAHAQGDSYRILAIGDPIAVNTTQELKNEAFTINGVNPTISVDANEQIVAGFLQEGRIITRSVSSLTSGLPDYIFSGDSISGQPVGDPLVGNSGFDTNNFDRQLDFNIGFDVVDNTPPALDLDLDLGDIWFIGDSITQSNADGDNNSSPRTSLLNLLLADNVDFTYTGHFTANNGGLPVTGSTPETNLYDYHSGISASVIGDNLDNRVGMTANLEAGIDFWNTGRLDTVKPEIILIKLGTNDVGQNFELATAPARISTLVDEILTLPNVGSPTFFISTIAPNRRSTREINDVAAFNAALPDIVAAQQLAGREVFLVDNFTPLNDDYDNLMRNDDLHPNASGNNVMAQQWYDAIMRRFDPEPGTSFADWQFENFGSTIATNASQELDPDGDSVTNFNEFAFGGDPNTADNNVRVAPLFDGLLLQFTRREASAAGLTYTLQESATLQEPDWFDVTDASVNVLSSDGAFENVEFTRPGGFIQAPRNFYRLNAIETP